MAAQRCSARSRAARSSSAVGDPDPRRFRVHLAGRATTVAALPVEGETPGHTHEPRPEPIAVAQLAEAAIRLHERLLRHLLSVLPVPQHAVPDPEGQCG